MGDSLKTLLTLPQLERFEFALLHEFPCIELPELKHLTEMAIVFLDNYPDFTMLFEVVKKIFSLKKLRIGFHDFFHIEDCVALNLVCGVVEAATSLRKDVLVNDDMDPSHTSKLMITKSSNQRAAEMILQHGEIFEITIHYKFEELFFENVAKFVRNKLYRYNTIVLENKKPN